jgi:hypothetical protein
VKPSQVPAEAVDVGFIAGLHGGRQLSPQIAFLLRRTFQNDLGFLKSRVSRVLLLRIQAETPRKTLLRVLIADAAGTPGTEAPTPGASPRTGTRRSILLRLLCIHKTAQAEGEHEMSFNHERTSPFLITLDEAAGEIYYFRAFA